jgi:hypothetical protein
MLLLTSVNVTEDSKLERALCSRNSCVGDSFAARLGPSKGAALTERFLIRLVLPTAGQGSTAKARRRQDSHDQGIAAAQSDTRPAPN